MAAVIALLAVLLATSVASARLLRFVFEDLDLLAYLGLFIACWIGAGGALVPVPGVRPVSWLMIVQQGGTLNPVVVTLVAAGAMVIGQSSYFIAARTTNRRRRAGMASAGEAARADEGADDPPAQGSTDARPGRMARAQSRIGRLVHEHGMATILLVTALPSPFTGLATTAAAVEEMSYPRFALAATCGYLVLCAVLSLMGQGLFAGLRICPAPTRLRTHLPDRGHICPTEDTSPQAP